MSREMDAAVCTDVLGWTVSTEFNVPCWSVPRDQPFFNGRYDGMGLHNKPFFFYDVHADYEVLKHVREKWEFAARSRMGQMLWAMWDLRGHTELAYEPGDFSLAALAALGVKEPA